MKSFMHQGLSLTLFLKLAALSLAQEDSNDDATLNPARDILSCDAVSCSQNDMSTICSQPSSDNADEIGVGLVSKAINVSDSTQLSLTLIDGYPVGSYGDSLSQYDYTTRTLYVGAPPDTNLSSQPRACVLMMQHQATTFPYATQDSSGSDGQSVTTCPQEFLLDGTTTRAVLSNVGNFSYPSSASLSYCEALAQYVEYRIHNDDIAFGVYYSALVTVAGGTVSGPGFATYDAADIPTSSDATSTNPDSCQPVQPANYQLYNVTSMTQVLRGGSMDQSPITGGRTGYTPIVSVVYGGDDGDDDYSNPEVQFLCMHLRQRDNEELPYSAIANGGAGASAIAESCWLVVAGALLASVLYSYR
ncbi:hypothetical protein B0A50_01606 [Salinomyces thailandicus]|uniref:Uncharacterized protein n=1 Tax=Salinomyces thailandicus TaxID=706561 RepID=A0A4U0UB03_9PEZI|nr:hypothetical protein B0A50_01606 [Salinomyces thailandica]